MRYVLEGSVRQSGGRVRITARLVDAASAAQLWAERYERPLDDVSAVQHEIAARVAGVIEPALADAEQRRVLRRPPERLASWEAWQRGQWHFHRYEADENRAAIDLFR